MKQTARLHYPHQNNMSEEDPNFSLGLSGSSAQPGTSGTPTNLPLATFERPGKHMLWAIIGRFPNCAATFSPQERHRVTFDTCFSGTASPPTNVQDLKAKKRQAAVAAKKAMGGGKHPPVAQKQPKSTNLVPGGPSRQAAATKYTGDGGRRKKKSPKKKVVGRASGRRPSHASAGSAAGGGDGGAAGTQRKPHHYRPGTMALREI